MSILVTCACTMEYRLPDRYAGKRCRCRECGGRIRVPRQERSSTDERRAKAKKRKKRRRSKGETPTEARKRRLKQAATTTRRMGAQDRNILSARRALRSSSTQKPVSESMHQLAPLRSGDTLDRYVGLTRKAEARKVSREKRAERARRRRERARRKDEKNKKGKTSTKGKTKASKGKRKLATEETQAIRSRQPRKGTLVAKKADGKRGGGKKTNAKKADAKKGRALKGKAPERKKRGKTTGKVKSLQGKKKGKATVERRRRPARKTRGYGRRKDVDEDDDAPRTKKSPTRAALYAVVAIAGVLCLGIGLAVGTTLFMANEVVNSEVDKKLQRIEDLKQARQWEFAQKEADELETLLTQLQDDQALSKLYAARAGVDRMVEVRKFEDDESKLDNLLNFATDKDPAVRHGVAWELRPIAPALEEAQQCLAVLAKDSDKKVADAAQQALVQAGGRHSVPYLLEAIERAGSTGSKQGDVALQRAIEVDDPAVSPVLAKALEVRPKAPASTLTQILERLGEYGDSACVPAVEPFTKHEDTEVAELAKAVIEEVKAR